MALIYGRSANAAGERAVEIDALVTLQTTNLSLPPGAINANRDVGGSTQSKINGDVTDLANPNDADIHANQNISQFESRSDNIQGKTYAVSTDAQPGIDNQTHSNQPPVTFPSASTAQSFANAAASKARAGTYLTAAQFIANGTSAYTGDVYVDGNVDMTQNAVTFAGGGTVYFNGSLCMSGQSSIINAASSTVVIKNEYAVSGNAGAYSTAPATRDVLVIMGSDIAPPCTGGTQAVAVNFSGNADSRIGVVYAPNGTVQLAGNGALTGAIDAGVDVLFNGSPGGSFTYDHNLSNVMLGTPTYVKITAYAEN